MPSPCLSVQLTRALFTCFVFVLLLSFFFLSPHITCWNQYFVLLCVLRLPRATDETLLDKLKQQHQDNPLFVASPNTKLTFTIQHFAGRVEYHIKVEYLSPTTNIVHIHIHTCIYIQITIYPAIFKSSKDTFNLSSVSVCWSAAALVDKPVWENAEESVWTKWMINTAPSSGKTVNVLWS